MKKGWFGTTDEERERGNFLKHKIGNHLPPPDMGLFQHDFNGNLEELLRQVRKGIAAKE